MERSHLEALYSFIKKLHKIEFNRSISMEEREKLERTILEKARDGKIPCALCFRIADDFRIPKKELTKILNEMKIKISQCQLGCFE
jgi:hypothetical protein